MHLYYVVFVGVLGRIGLVWGCVLGRLLPSNIMLVTRNRNYGSN